MNTNKTFQVTLTLSRVGGEWVGVEDTTCVICDFSGLEVTHCIAVFVLSLGLFASQVCAWLLKLTLFYLPKTKDCTCCKQGSAGDPGSQQCSVIKENSNRL